MSDKKVNYTQAQTTELVEAYEAAKSEAERESVIEEHAYELQKTVKSVRAKLVREGVYIKKSKKAKDGNSAETKASIVEDIADTLGLESDVIGSLENATKNTLQIIRGEFVAAKALLAGEGQKPDSE